MCSRLNTNIEELRDIRVSTLDTHKFSAHPPLNNKPPKFLAEVNWLDRWLTKKMLDVAGNPPVRIVLWDGVEVPPYCDNPVAVLFYQDRAALIKTIVDPELHWGDLYSAGRIEFAGDMVRFIENVYRGMPANSKTDYLRRLVQWLSQRRSINSIDKARENIHYHYDIGNAFYKLWLDREEMQYTCAYFPQENMTLEQAQIAKLHHVCRKLQIKPGDTVVEVGCGWGGLAHFMARNYGARVTAYNISSEQVKYARQRAEEDGLSDQVEYILDDYRNIQGQFDVFVSVGMLEHVAKQDYRALGRLIKHCLKPEGRGLIHSIGRILREPMNPWIERRIFPGACPPALSEMMQIFEPNDLAVMDVENLRLHYSRTLEQWAERFERNKPAITAMMDEEFVRAWGLYLYGSIAAFNVGRMQLFQVVFNHRENNHIPWTRQHIYQHDTADNPAKTNER